MIEKFNVALIYNVVHDSDTKQIAQQMGNGKWSKFVRQAIFEFAKDKGFELPADKPFYMPDSKWQKVQEAQKKQRYVDYDYVIAYHWLAALPDFLLATKSEIIRKAIKWFYSSFRLQVD